MSNPINDTDLGLDVRKGDETEVFKWFLASYLFGKRIQQGIAKQTWEVLMRNKLDSPQKIVKESQQHLVDLLDEGQYKRYDESTASNILAMAHFLNEHYRGKITEIANLSSSRSEIERHLQEIKGVGPKTVQIFMRPMKRLWY